MIQEFQKNSFSKLFFNIEDEYEILFQLQINIRMISEGCDTEDCSSAAEYSALPSQE